MKRLMFATSLLLCGCGVSKDLYRQQVVRSDALEVRANDLEERLRESEDRRGALESELRRLERTVEGMKSDYANAVARGDMLQGRVEASAVREAEVRADLDVCRKAQGAREAELERVGRLLEEERAARKEESALSASALEACRGETADLAARVAVLVEQRERAEREKREKLDEISRTYDGLLQGMEQEIRQGRVTISQLKGKLSVQLLDEILFDSGRADLKPAGADVLKRLGDVLVQLEDKAIVIEGHTDRVPISGELAKRFPTNWELSTARATSVVRYLQDTVGVDPERLSAVGFGPYRPVATNDTPEGRMRNRRIEIKLVPLEAPLFQQEGEPSLGVEPESSERPEAGPGGADEQGTGDGSP